MKDLERETTALYLAASEGDPQSNARIDAHFAKLDAERVAFEKAEAEAKAAAEKPAPTIYGRPDGFSDLYDAALDADPKAGAKIDAVFARMAAERAAEASARAKAEDAAEKARRSGRILSTPRR